MIPSLFILDNPSSSKIVVTTLFGVKDMCNFNIQIMLAKLNCFALRSLSSLQLRVNQKETSYLIHEEYVFKQV